CQTRTRRHARFAVPIRRLCPGLCMARPEMPARPNRMRAGLLVEGDVATRIGAVGGPVKISLKDKRIAFCVFAETNRRDPSHKEAAHIKRSTCQGIKPQSNILLAIGGATLSINASRIWGSLLRNCIALCSSLLGGAFCAFFCQSSSQVVC